MFLLVETTNHHFVPAKNGKAATFLANTCLQFSDTILTGVLRNYLTLTGILRFFSLDEEIIFPVINVDTAEQPADIERQDVPSRPNISEKENASILANQRNNNTVAVQCRDLLNQVKSLSYIKLLMMPANLKILENVYNTVSALWKNLLQRHLMDSFLSSLQPRARNQK